MTINPHRALIQEQFLLLRLERKDATRNEPSAVQPSAEMFELFKCTVSNSFCLDPCFPRQEDASLSTEDVKVFPLKRACGGTVLADA